MWPENTRSNTIIKTLQVGADSVRQRMFWGERQETLRYLSVWLTLPEPSSYSNGTCVIKSFRCYTHMIKPKTHFRSSCLWVRIFIQRQYQQDRSCCCVYAIDFANKMISCKLDSWLTFTWNWWNLCPSIALCDDMEEWIRPFHTWTVTFLFFFQPYTCVSMLLFCAVGVGVASSSQGRLLPSRTWSLLMVDKVIITSTPNLSRLVALCRQFLFRRRINL